MKLVVDTNVLVTFFWRNSVFNRFLLEKNLILFSSELALEEINRNSPKVLKKAKLSLEEFKKLRRELALKVEFVPLEEYSKLFKKAERLAESFKEDEKSNFLKDIDFFALALYLDIPLWSNDKLFKKQSEAVVFSTEDLIKLFS